MIVAIIGFAGWFVYNSQKKTNATLNKSAQSQGESQRYLVIKEWDIELPLSSDFQDATYSCLGYGCSVPNEFGISTMTLTKLDSQCAANASGIGFISRQTVTEHDANISKNDKYAYPVYGTRVDNYYYEATPTAKCGTSNDAANQKQASYAHDFTQALAGIKTAN